MKRKILWVCLKMAFRYKRKLKRFRMTSQNLHLAKIRFNYTIIGIFEYEFLKSRLPLYLKNFILIITGRDIFTSKLRKTIETITKIQKKFKLQKFFYF